MRKLARLVVTWALVCAGGCSGARSVWNHEWCDVGPEPRLRAEVVRAGVELSEDAAGELHVSFEALLDARAVVAESYFNVNVWDEVSGSRDKLKKQPLCPGGCPAPEPDGRVRVKGRVRRQLRDPAVKTKYEATVDLWTGSDELVCFLTRFDVGLGGPAKLPGRRNTKDEL
jgi:hypothetical protein